MIYTYGNTLSLHDALPLFVGLRADDSQSIDSPRARVIEAERLAKTQENLAQAAPLAINSPQP